MTFFQPPKTKYNNFYDEARFNLTWKLNTYMFLVNIPLVIAAYFFKIEEFLAVLFGWLVPLVYLIILYITKKYKVLASVYVVLGTVTITPLMYFVPTTFHHIQMLFMVMICLYAFIVLGKSLGLVTVIVNAVGLVLYFHFGLNRDILNNSTLDTLELYWNTANFLLAFSMVCYLILEFTRLNKHAEEKYVNSNLELTKTNTIVELRDKEKTIMLQEIHHRVKNNLQVITSLLRLQSHEVKDEKSREQFEDAINRVIAMSMIHEKMYQTHDFATLNLEEYLRSLSNELISSYSITKPVKVSITSTLNNIGNKAIVPLSLIFNELISNSLKHAFSDKESGEISITINPLTDDRFELHYSDNGLWKNQESAKSFGLELLETFAEQMSGSVVRVVDNSGTHYTISLTNLH